MANGKIKFISNYRNFNKEVVLDRISDGKFRVLEFGDLKPILYGGNLVSNAIAVIFKKYVPEQIDSVKNVTIWRKSTGETWTNYSEIRFKNQLDLENFEKVAFDRLRVYQLMHDHIYISKELMDKFMSEYVNIEELEFENNWPIYG